MTARRGSTASEARESATDAPSAVVRIALSALVADAVLIVVFAAIGRRTHDEAGAILGPLQTAWPFLAGMALGWLLACLARRRTPLTVRAGIPVWLGAVAAGMALRALTGQGTAWPFVIIATLTLAVLLLGWRSLLALGRAARHRPAQRY